MNRDINKVDYEMSLGFTINRVAILFRRELIRCFRKYKITPEQWQLLVALWKHQTLNQIEISHITYQDAPSISRMINRMVINGWVRKDIAPFDARITQISLTPLGSGLKNELPQKLLKHFSIFLDKYGKTNQSQLLKLLIELKSCFE